MSLPFTFPDWMPWWLQLLVVVVGLVLLLAFAIMPFSVFGVKSRLELLESRLDEMQADLRALVMRLPEPGREPYDAPAILRAAAAKPEPVAPKTPPIPPASWAVEPEREIVPAKEAEPARPVAPLKTVEPTRESLSPTLRAAARVGGGARERAEPRLGRAREPMQPRPPV